MAVREIPASYEYTCDGCGAKQNAKSRPPHWTRLKIERDAYDYQGNACADASIDRLLCKSCSEIVFNAVNASLSGLRPLHGNQK